MLLRFLQRGSSFSTTPRSLDPTTSSFAAQFVPQAVVVWLHSPLRSEPALHVLICRFPMASELLAGILDASIDCFVSVGKFNIDRSCSKQPVQSCSCSLTKPYPSPPSGSPIITRLGSFALRIRATSPAKESIRFRTVVSKFSHPVLASASVQDIMW